MHRAHSVPRAWSASVGPRTVAVTKAATAADRLEVKGAQSKSIALHCIPPDLQVLEEGDAANDVLDLGLDNALLEHLADLADEVVGLHAAGHLGLVAARPASTTLLPTAPPEQLEFTRLLNFGGHTMGRAARCRRFVACYIITDYQVVLFSHFCRTDLNRSL